MKKLLLLTSLVYALGVVGCARKHHPAPPKHTKQTHVVHHFADGRYGYRGANDVWFFYYVVLMNNNVANTTVYVNSSPFNLPPGGAWVATPLTNVLPAEVGSAAVAVAVTDTGEPLAPETVVTETQMEFDFMHDGSLDQTPSSEPAGEAPAADSGSSDSSAGSDAGGSDAGSSDPGPGQ